MHPKKYFFIAFEGRNRVQIFLEIYTLSTYSDVMSYVIREPEIQHVYMAARESRFQEIEYFACVCVCVLFPFILDFNGRTSRGHTGRR